MRIYRSEVPVSVPQDVNLTELINSNARFPAPPESHIIAKDDIQGRILTIGQLRSNAGRLACGLNDAFRPPDQSRWAIILPNSVAYFEACHAVLWLGGVFCPINHLLTAREIGNALAICKPKYVIVFAEVVDKITEGITIWSKEHPFSEAPQIITAIGQRDPHPSLQQFLSNPSLPIPHYPHTHVRLASIHLSSGTTGSSKGVGLSHFNYVANVLQMWAHDPAHWSPDEQVVSFTPFVHIANTTIPLFLGPWTGMLHIIMAKFELEACCRLVQENRASSMQLSPLTAVAIAKTDLTSRYDLSSIRHMVVGGLPLTRDLYDKFLSKGKWKTVQLYGMTEAAPYVVWQKIDEEVEQGQLGKLLPGMEARLCDDNGNDTKEGGPGEMWIKGPNVTSGYVDNPEATKAAFKDDGWYNTGDICTFSSTGYFSIVGRTKELIKYSGFQVAPVELETYLNGHPAIADCAVGAIVDRTRMTELPTAYVILNATISQREDKLKALRAIQHSTDSQVTGYKKLRGGVWEVTELPRTSTGKFMRKHLGTYTTGLNSMTTAGSSKL